MGLRAERWQRTWAGALLSGVVLAPGIGAQAQKPYVVPVSLRVEAVEIALEVGESARGYRLAGRPDGMGLLPLEGGAFRLYVNHELARDEGEARAHGGKGAFVSQWEIKPHTDQHGLTLYARSGQDAIRKVLDTTGAEYRSVSKGRFGPLCSAHLAGAAEGFDRPIFLTGEESRGADTLDGQPGGRSYAVFEGQAWALPRLGRYAKENQVVLRGTGERTAVVGLEDGPETPDSQVYLYLGTKEPDSRDALARNGLSNGGLFVLRVEGAATEEDIREKGAARRCSFVPVRYDQTAEALEREADALGATGFVRVEDGVQDPSSPRTFYFVTTGSEYRGKSGRHVNHNGRLYRLVFDSLSDPSAGGTLELILKGSEGVVSPDNLAMDDKGVLLIAEDPTFPLSGRASSLWQVDTRTGDLVRLLEVNPAAAGPSFEPSDWEITGTVDASRVLGSGWWLMAVQAHGVPAPPALVEGGQILAVRLGGP
ncbi:MAG: alkaline phosphatase PhoX [Acidobacteriota bacterium]